MKIKISLTGLGVLVVLSSLLMAGCAPLLIAGGAVGGYAVAKNANDGSSSSAKK